MGVSDSCDRECYRYAGPSPSSVLGQVFAFTLPITSVQDRLSACGDQSCRVGSCTGLPELGRPQDLLVRACRTINRKIGAGRLNTVVGSQYAS